MMLCEAVIDVMVNIRSDFPLSFVQNQLLLLVNKAKDHIEEEQNLELKLKKLFELFYNKWGFGGAKGPYNLSDVLWLDKVLKTKQGTAISLSVILIHIASELKLTLMPIIFPTQLILRVDWNDSYDWLIDPFTGDTLNISVLESWLKGNIDLNAKLHEDDLDEATNISVIYKMLTTLKVALMEEKKMELALNVNKILLLINPNDPYEIRDRGLIYTQLDCEHIAINDLIYFVEHCPEDLISEMIKFQINIIKQKKIILH
ncbi:tetratricopeptide repeat protein [Pantoea sp. SoEX]|nr:tetratricopeptide repeat protein [Pantoea sp. SoEX]